MVTTASSETTPRSPAAVSLQGVADESPELTVIRATIVCADDDPQALERLQVLLTQEGFEVFPCASAPAALECIWERLPDLLIIDPMMAHMAGLALCKQLRANPETERLPILLHTATALPATEGGLYDCVCAKPAQLRALLLVIRTLLMERP
jgi:DNA-binding response OmpR family regulator